jgi:BASS family bile acid:Na+ symporter
VDSLATSFALPVVLAAVMFGLGLSLTVEDFLRVRNHRTAVGVALACQVVLLPLVCLGLISAFGTEPTFAVGMMLLAASPGGPAANVFSHLFGGDVALNVTLTAVNSVIAVVTLPLVANWALGHFDHDLAAGDVGLQFGKVVQVFAIVLVPVVLGVVVRSRRPDFAVSMDSPVRTLSAAVLVVVILGTAVAERSNIGDYLTDVGALAVSFAVCSLAVGYVVPRAVGVARRQAVACAMEIGIHNAALAITVAISVLDSVDLAVPPAVYAVVVFPLAAALGALVGRAGTESEPEPALA